jgi:hypothetical protein
MIQITLHFNKNLYRLIFLLWNKNKYNSTFFSLLSIPSKHDGNYLYHVLLYYDDVFCQQCSSLADYRPRSLFVYLYVPYVSHNKRRLLPYTAITSISLYWRRNSFCELWNEFCRYISVFQPLSTVCETLQYPVRFSGKKADKVRGSPLTNIWYLHVYDLLSDAVCRWDSTELYGWISMD